jgi:hypothetical protein
MHTAATKTRAIGAMTDRRADVVIVVECYPQARYAQLGQRGAAPRLPHAIRCI